MVRRRAQPYASGMTTDVAPARASSRRQSQRWLVHLGLIATAVVSLVFEFVLTVHIVLGLIFCALVVAHVAQRRRTSNRLLRRLVRVTTWHQTQGRLALADLFLLVMTAAMLASGLWDWSLGHPTRVRYHAITGVVLAFVLLVHTWRRRRRLRSSRVR